MQPGRAIELEDDVVAGELPVLALTAQLDLAAAQVEPVISALALLLLVTPRRTFFAGRGLAPVRRRLGFVLPDQVVVAKGQ
ncbi:hypothetical protein D3C79_903270 [compost metagenome]